MTALHPLRIFVGFDFYGAGNIGDDLMVEGFLGEFASKQAVELTCALPPECLASQRLRFPSIRWIATTPEERIALIKASDLWLGIGGTPFQASGGRWLLKRILADFEAAPAVPKWMLGIGCEAEVIEEFDMAAQVLAGTERIWTRDEASRSVLFETFQASVERVITGGDLAHLAMEELTSSVLNRADVRQGVGLILFGERFRNDDLREIKSFVSSLYASQPVTFLANDVRRGRFEHKMFARLYDGPLSRFFRRPDWLAPDYTGSDLAALVAHFRRFDTVISSRYHGLVAAAWAGCRVGAIARNSKISFLADELGIPVLSGPLTSRALNSCLEDARPVSRNILRARSAAAREMLGAFSGALEDSYRHV